MLKHTFISLSETYEALTNLTNHCVCVCVFSGAEVREVDLKAVTGGIVHTKLWVVDQKHFYVGSANMDWRSLSQVKHRGKECIFKCICISGGMAPSNAPFRRLLPFT